MRLDHGPQRQLLQVHQLRVDQWVQLSDLASEDRTLVGDIALSRREEASRLADSLLSDIELARVAPLDIARRAGRLARLVDDADAMAWLKNETSGYPEGALSHAAADAANRSGRRGPDEDGQPRWWTTPLGQLEIELENALTEVNGLSQSSTGGEWALAVENSRSQQRRALRAKAAFSRQLIDRVVGSIHQYVLERHHELRFGAAVESSFEVVRAEVDRSLAALVPEAMPMLAAAFESASSSKPEHWANAAGTCRRLIEAVADALRPPGPDKSTPDGKLIRLGKRQYINRLVDWIQEHSDSETTAGMITADLAYLGARLDAADRARQKGVHGRVGRLEAARYLVGTYLVLGDIIGVAAGRMEQGATPSVTAPANTTLSEGEG
jgi:hypothetical protein